MYIRTKDGVYEVSHYNDWATHKRKGATLIDGDKLSYIKNEDIISQSENLAELCDCFIGELDGKKVVLEKWNGNKFVIRWAANMVSMIKDLNKTYANVKGAVWTEWGLKYVAKMNDKGELELI